MGIQRQHTMYGPRLAITAVGQIRREQGQWQSVPCQLHAAPWPVGINTHTASAHRLHAGIGQCCAAPIPRPLRRLLQRPCWAGAGLPLQCRRRSLPARAVFARIATRAQAAGIAADSDPPLQALHRAAQIGVQRVQRQPKVQALAVDDQCAGATTPRQMPLGAQLCDLIVGKCQPIADKLGGDIGRVTRTAQVHAAAHTAAPIGQQVLQLQGVKTRIEFDAVCPFAVRAQLALPQCQLGIARVVVTIDLHIQLAGQSTFAQAAAQASDLQLRQQAARACPQFAMALQIAIHRTRPIRREIARIKTRQLRLGRPLQCR